MGTVTAPGAQGPTGTIEVSLIDTILLVATTVPEILLIRAETVKVSPPSVVESAIVVILKEPVSLLIVKEPEVTLKSLLIVVILLIVQYNVVLLDTLVVLRLKVPEKPSLIEVGIVPKIYVGVGGVGGVGGPVSPMS